MRRPSPWASRKLSRITVAGCFDCRNLDHCKRAVLNSLGSPASRRVYEYAIDQFIDTANLKRSFGKFPSHLSEKYAEQTVANLKAAHIPILAGTDAPNPGTSHGASIHRGLQLLVLCAAVRERHSFARFTCFPIGNVIAESFADVGRCNIGMGARK